MRTMDATTARPVLRVLVAAGLAVDAYVHIDLASGYDSVTSGSVSQGDLFRVEAAAAALAAIAVLLVRRRISDLVALLVALGGVVAVVLYRYVDVGAIGPLPSMYEPLWYGEKTLSLVAEAIASVAALVLVTTRPRLRTSTRENAHALRS
jgi:energy-converting hydrogenase Eha subunit C